MNQEKQTNKKKSQDIKVLEKKQVNKMQVCPAIHIKI
jgi:hypothetical protein